MRVGCLQFWAPSDHPGALDRVPRGSREVTQVSWVNNANFTRMTQVTWVIAGAAYYY